MSKSSGSQSGRYHPLKGGENFQGALKGYRALGGGAVDGWRMIRKWENIVFVRIRDTWV